MWSAAAASNHCGWHGGDVLEMSRWSSERVKEPGTGWLAGKRFLSPSLLTALSSSLSLSLSLSLFFLFFRTNCSRKHAHPLQCRGISHPPFFSLAAEKKGQVRIAPSLSLARGGLNQLSPFLSRHHGRIRKLVPIRRLVRLFVVIKALRQIYA